jgi:hypothetical protein
LIAGAAGDTVNAAVDIISGAKHHHSAGRSAVFLAVSYQLPVCAASNHSLQMLPNLLKVPFKSSTARAVLQAAWQSLALTSCPCSAS